MVQGIFWF